MLKTQIEKLILSNTLKLFTENTKHFISVFNQLVNENNKLKI